MERRKGECSIRIMLRTMKQANQKYTSWTYTVEPHKYCGTFIWSLVQEPHSDGTLLSLQLISLFQETQGR